MNFLDFVFPKVCLGCGKAGLYICKNCVDKLPMPPGICPICGKPSIDGVTHTKCLSPFSLNGLNSIWPYQGVMRKALITLKYKFAYEIANEISVFLADKLSHPTLNSFKNALFVPIPSHPLRKDWRGFNQAEIIGKSISDIFGWRFAPEILFRKRIVAPQTGLRGKERRQNIRGVFCLNPDHKLHATGCILFDDVWTTGSTLKEACKVLKRKGAKTIWGLTIARVY